jgi:predicted amidophosphoribosyltransferase
VSSANQIRCNGCRVWFTKDRTECPECGQARPGFSKALAMGKVNGHLYDMARSADREAKIERSLRSR